MAYLVLARKYRPQTFEDVVRQEHVTRTLRNAVTSGRLAHAILFSGPRGTGKTTIARILAKCMNCQSGPTATPCNTCHACKEITNSNAVDVFEIDGASNNKVENVRELRENAKYMPAKSPYKIYIIDEVHMLSDSAFNALLKILEEPPAHVLFFFATTEPNKIPITILSRCQRYDLRRVEIDAIIAHMADLCRREGIEIAENGLAIIAREADGSIRDALSLLDQIITCATDCITAEQITDILGVIDRQVLFDVSAALFAGDMAKILEICDRLYHQGRDLMRFYTDLISHFRNLLVLKMGGSKTALTDVPAHELPMMNQQIENVPEPYVARILDALFADEWRVKQSVSPKLALEMTFFKLLQIRPALSLDTLIEKLDRLKDGISVSTGTPTPISPKADPTSPIAQTRQARAEAAPLQENEISAEPGAETPDCGTPDLEPAAEETDLQPENTGSSSAPASEAESVEDIWDKLRAWLVERSPVLGACLAEGRITSLSEDGLEIEVRSAGANVELLNRKRNRENLEKLCRRYFNRELRVNVIIDDSVRNANEQKKQAEKRLREKARRHPLVEAAVKTFDGKIVDVKIL